MIPARAIRRMGATARTLLRDVSKTCVCSTSALITPQNINISRSIVSPRYMATKTGQHGTKPGAFEYYSQIIKNLATNGVTVLSGPIRVYKRMVKDGELNKDPYQMATIRLLQHLYEKIETFYGGIDYNADPNDEGEKNAIPKDRVCEDDAEDKYSNEGKPQWLLDIFYRIDKTSGETCTVKTIRAPKGVYIWGVPGSGKSVMTDILYHCIDNEIPKEKMSFDEFIRGVKEAIQQYKQVNGENADAVTAVAREIGSNTKILFLDDFSVEDEEVAMMLQKLFIQLFYKDVCIVITSLQAPDDLYKDGKDREKFLSFIELLKHQCPGIYINSNKDYRFGKNSNTKTFYSPTSIENDKKINNLLASLNNGDQIQWHQNVLRSAQGKKLVVPFSDKNICQFLFANICGEDKDIIDYLTVCNNYHTLVLKNIPQMTSEDLPQLKKFVLLVDELYEHKVKLICSSDVPMKELFVPDESTPKDDILAFNRTLKRLEEMQTRAYLQKLHPLQKKKTFNFSFLK